MKKFLDTNILLHDLDYIKELDKFVISSITLEEIEHIKTSNRKDEEVKFNARQATRYLFDNEDKYEVVVAQRKHHEFLDELELDHNNDNLIMACAKLLEEDIEFLTMDLCCFNLAKGIFALNVVKFENNSNGDTDYKGYKEVIMSDKQMADFYSKEEKENTYDLLENGYLIIKDTLNQPVDAWRFDGLELIPLDVKPIKSNMFGKLKAKDFYQQCALDSFYHNQITMIKGKAGSGKSYLALNFLFSQLEKGKIDKIIMFINDAPVRNANLHGFLPGTLTEKLCESQIGNFLLGKLGDKIQITHLISMGQLLLLPISDIRGFDSSNMNAGIFITESQNMSIDMMKLALQRIGEDCICIIDGDCNAQVDNKMFEGKNNGMIRLSEVFRGKDIYGEIELNTTYRSRLAEIAELM